MLFTVGTQGFKDLVFSVDSLDSTSIVLELREAIAAQAKVAPYEISFIKREGKAVSEDLVQTLDKAGLQQNDFLHVEIHDSEPLRIQALNQPSVLAEFQRTRPTLARAVRNSAAFRTEFLLYLKQVDEVRRQQRVAENYYTAMDRTPEVFGRVEMLFIPILINNVPLLAFVDSGAQTTIISQSCADKCKLAYLIDSRFQGQAVGVGTGNITGKIHYAEVQIGNAFTTTSLTVLENSGVDLLLGLDMLRRHQVNLDLRRNKFCIDNEEVDFVPAPNDSSLGVEGLVGPGTSGVTVEQVPPTIPSQQSASSAIVGGNVTTQEPRSSSMDTPMANQAIPELDKTTPSEDQTQKGTIQEAYRAKMIADFCETTGCSENVATQALVEANWDSSLAQENFLANIERFLEE